MIMVWWWKCRWLFCINNNKKSVFGCMHISVLYACNNQPTRNNWPTIQTNKQNKTRFLSSNNLLYVRRYQQLYTMMMMMMTLITIRLSRKTIIFFSCFIYYTTTIIIIIITAVKCNYNRKKNIATIEEKISAHQLLL